MPVRKQTTSITLAIKGVAYGIPSIRVDGNDALAVYTIARGRWRGLEGVRSQRS